MIKSLLFYIPTGINISAILVALYFIVTDESRYGGSGNSTLLLVTLLMGGWVALCWYLRSTKTPVVGTILAWLPAVPLILYGLFVLMFIILSPDMK